jgi:general L-amino acid transport system ATP-binding protein
MSEPIIIARDVHKWYGHFHALRGISMEVQRGEVCVIFGPSGSGKSTFIRTLNRLEDHQRGTIIIDGIELSHDTRNIAAIRREVGMVFQQFNLFPHLTVLQNITLGPIHVRKWPKEKAEEVALQLLRRVGIPEQAHKYPGQLSGGQQQRVAIARALAMQPKIMLFDEPTSAPRPGDDQRGARRDDRAGPEWHDHARGHARDGLCPRSRPPHVVFDQGESSSKVGTPEQIFENPQQERTKLFLSQILHHK